MKSGYKYYRILYSLFATISLVLLIWYQFSIRTIDLWKTSVLENIFSILLGSCGLLMMLLCIKKYFYTHSGIAVFIKKQTVVHLEQKGLHKIVRHPLYLGTLLFAWSVFLYFPTLANLIACICIAGYIRTGIYFEEKKLLSEFGDGYKNYSKKVPMLIPHFFQK
jgi:protein-S-isoprenylcysteine O-methyltransferase Ste14